LASTPFCTKHHSVGSSDKRRMHRCLGIGSSGAPDPKSLATAIFSFSLSSLEPKTLRMVILTIILLQVLCCHSITKITRNGINGVIFVWVPTIIYHDQTLASSCMLYLAWSNTTFHPAQMDRQIDKIAVDYYAWVKVKTLFFLKKSKN